MSFIIYSRTKENGYGYKIGYSQTAEKIYSGIMTEVAHCRTQIVFTVHSLNSSALMS